MASFENAISMVLRHEGGFVDNPLDNGGPTNYGITLKTLDMYYKNTPEILSPETIKNLTIDQAKNIYKNLFWIPMNLEFLNNQILANIILDLSILQGMNYISKTIQSLIGNPTNIHLMLTDIKLINSLTDSKGLAFKIIKVSQLHFVNIVKSNPSQIVFLEGWILRSQDLLKDLVSL